MMQSVLDLGGQNACGVYDRLTAIQDVQKAPSYPLVHANVCLRFEHFLDRGEPHDRVADIGPLSRWRLMRLCSMLYRVGMRCLLGCGGGSEGL